MSRRHNKWRDALADIEDDDNGETCAAPAPVEADSVDDVLESVRASGSATGLNVVVDTDDHGGRVEVEQAEMVAGTDGDDNPVYRGVPAKLVTRGRTVKVRTVSGETESVEVIEPGQIVEAVPLRLDVANNPAAQMIDAGHGFDIDDRRSRPWKTARRTHCEFCGGLLPLPDLSKYPCDFDGPIETPRHDVAVGDDRTFRCRCGGCELRGMIATRHERGKGKPPKFCSERCKTDRRNELDRWRRAVVRAEKRGEEPPPEPEDRGLKWERRSGLRSGAEGMTARA